MSSLVLGAVGATVGFFTGGPAGAFYGFGIGYGVGAARDARRVQGAQVGDLRVTGSAYGEPIPWVRGAPRVSGQIIWASKKRPTAQQSSGKGGGSVTTGYTYTVDVLYLLADGTNVKTISRIFWNGELVWTRLTGASNASLSASDGNNRWSRLTFYDGNATQLADPTVEADVGAGNAPANRGRATLMTQGLSLGSSDQLPNLTFELVTESAPAVGDITSTVQVPWPTPYFARFTGTPARQSAQFQVPIGVTASAGSADIGVTVFNVDALTGAYSVASTYTLIGAASTTTSAVAGTSDTTCLMTVNAAGTTYRLNLGTTGASTTYTVPVALVNARFALEGSTLIMGGASGGGKVLYRFTVGASSPVVTSSPLPQFVQSLLIVGSTVYASSRNTTDVYVLDVATLTLQSTITRPGVSSDTWTALMFFNGQLAIMENPAAQTVRIHQLVAGSFVQLGQINTTTYYATSERYATVSIVGGLVIGGLNNTADQPRYDVWIAPITTAAGGTSLRSIVSDLCDRAAMPAGTYDVSAVPTTLVRSIAVTGGTTRTILEQLATAYFLTCSARDKAVFGVRGGSVAATIPATDLAAGPDEAADQPLAINLGNELELPPRAVVTFINANNDGQTGSEPSDRMTAGQAAVRQVTLGIGMTPGRAKWIADAMVADAAAALVTAPVALPLPYAKLDPSDVVNVVDRDGRTYRLRLERLRDERGALSFETVGDDASVIVSAQITDETQTPNNTVDSPSATVLYPLNAPLLRDVDDGPGFIVAARGLTTTWPGAAALISADGVSYSTGATVTESAIMGTCTTTLGNFTGAGVDEVNTLTLNLGPSTPPGSVTRDALLADESVNAWLIGAEVVRSATVTLVSTNPTIVTLSRLLRGQKGTEWAISGHGSGELCTLLRPQGLRRIVQQQNAVGQAIWIKGVTLGANAANVGAQSFTNASVSQKPLAPTAIRGTAVTGQDLLLSWKRRSRLSSRFLSTLGVPLGEGAEQYLVRIYAATNLKRTLSSTTTSLLYTRAMQIADGFTSQGAQIRVDVTQFSAYIGEGYIGTGITYSAASPLAQIVAITLGGSFAAGLEIRVALGSTQVSYTTVGGDTDLNGVAASLRTAINTATATYTATVSGQVVTVTGPVSTPYGYAATVVPGDNAITLAQTQAAAPIDPVGGRYQAAITYTNGGVPVITSGLNIELIPGGITFGVQFERPAGTIVGVASYTTPAPQFAFQVHAGLTSAIAAASSLNVPGYGAGINYLTGVEQYVVFGPYGVTGVAMSTFATAPYGMAVSVQALGSPPTPSALPQIVTATLSGTATAGYVYRITLAGVPFTYTAAGGDTMTIVAAALATAIDADAAFTATSSGAVVTITGATAGVAFTFAADIQSGATTVAAAITQEAS